MNQQQADKLGHYKREVKALNKKGRWYFDKLIEKLEEDDGV